MTCARSVAGAWLALLVGCTESTGGPAPSGFEAGLVRPRLLPEAPIDAPPASLAERAPDGWFDARAGGRAGLLRRSGERRFGLVAAVGERWSFACDGPALPADARLTLSLAAWSPDEAAGARAVVTIRIEPSADPSRGTELARVEVGARDWVGVDVELAGVPDEPGRIVVDVAGPAGGWVALADLALHAPKPDPRTVLLITSDTHRGDHVSVVGRDGRVATPGVAQLGRRGLSFVDCFASSNITVPSHVALMTGLHPRDTGVRDNRTPLSARAETLAERFREGGFATYAATSIDLLTPEHSGLGQGFDRYSATKKRRPGHETIQRLLSWLPDARGKPLFVWCHLFDAHAPYRPPAELIDWPRERDPRAAHLPEPAGRVPDWAPDVRDLGYVRGLYRACVRFVDLALRRLLAAPRFERAIVAFTADHGESLGQHDIWWAHRALYPDTLHVPLVLAWPEGPGTVAERPVRQIDVGRTLLDLAGSSDADFPGRSLLREPPEEEAWPRFALEGGRRSASITWRGWHLIRSLEEHTRGLAEEVVFAGKRELYDLRTDPKARRDRSATEGDRLRELDEALLRWLDEPDARDLAAPARDDEATRRRLSELGYVDEAGE